MKVLIRIEGSPEELQHALPERMDGTSEVDVQLRLGNRPKYIGRLDQAAQTLKHPDRWISTVSTNGDLQDDARTGMTEPAETGPRESRVLAMANSCVNAMCSYCSAGHGLIAPGDDHGVYQHSALGGPDPVPCQANAIHWLLRRK